MNRINQTFLILFTVLFTFLTAGPAQSEPVKPMPRSVKPDKVSPKMKTPVKPMPGKVPRPGPTPEPLAKPDLQVGLIQVTPRYPGEGQTVTFKANVMNYGDGPAVNPVAFLKIDAPAGVTMQHYRKQFNLTLGKNQGITFLQTFKVPKAGDYTCKFKIDPARMIAETNDNNNDENLDFTVDPEPDLVVCISNGKRPPVGGSRTARAVVRNIGTRHTDHDGTIRLRFYLEGKGAKNYDIPPLPNTFTHEVTRKPRWSTSGTKTISAKVTYTKYEISTQNNEVSGSFFVRLPHHDQYSTAPKVKCSTGHSFNSWQDCNNFYLFQYNQ